MTKFFEHSQPVNVSRITPDGWWIENTVEHVSKGTALGSDFTQTVYTPSSAGMIAHYDRDKDVWSNEIEDMTWKAFWDEHGRRYVIGQPDGDYPEWAIQEHPPEYDPDTQTVLYKEDEWAVYEILIGQSYYNEWGMAFLVSDYNFELPDHHVFEAPPEPNEGFAIKLVKGTWQEVPDHRGQYAYAKDRDNPELYDYLIETIGDVPDTHTLLAYQPYDSWMNDVDGWAYDPERHKPVRAAEELEWRDRELFKVLSRIDQYEKDQNYPEALRTSPIKTEEQFIQLLRDRKVLSDYPDSDGFPFSERPQLSGLSD
ncbi:MULTISPECIES: hypothetical protein [unclassified Vibrio]|uniref:hypothetical protein n=1 Tax=unclassified Vibrio TaxID=2614977 RepID=UPI0013619D36|nr:MULTISPECIES: hypothetical protein [unclassified Vibrio]NAW59644.1 hypothetical protein [Vibrio sp. V36_P2S2PM302]NAX25016.1 hypothetical protein [Vibrio sp. V38_P2S17PM301]NAX28602.1 hypothetical protein [Vibrio sp. V37_P2S8PM304]